MKCGDATCTKQARFSFRARAFEPEQEERRPLACDEHIARIRSLASARHISDRDLDVQPVTLPA